MPKRTLTATFEFTRQTPGALRYDEVAPEGEHLVGGLYLRKRKMEEPWPARITATFEMEGEAEL